MSVTRPLLLALTLAALSLPAAARDEKKYADPDWPCVSRKVVELTAGQLWDGPAIDEANTAWQNDDTIRNLTAYLLARRIKPSDMEAAVKKYADGLAAGDRDKKLTELFAAVLSRSNGERRTVISGIERFHKRQLARAAAIEKAGLELPKVDEQLPTAPMEADKIDALTPEQEKMKWEIRVFQERQQNIPIACEIPQLMEERTGAVARAIRAQMKG